MGEISLGAAAESTVQAYKELANDPSKRFSLSLDQTCVQFLAYIIAEGTGTLVQSAVDTFELLAATPECRPPLANTFGVLEALQEMADDARYTEELRNQAGSLFTCLQFSRHVKLNEEVFIKPLDGEPSSEIGEREDTKQRSKSPSPTSEVSNKVQFAGLSLLTKNEKATGEKKFLGPHNSKAKTVTLLVNGMVNQKHRQRVEDELVRVRGLISIVFDSSGSRVTCRVKNSLVVEKLAAAISEAGFEAQQVVTNQNGDETVMKIGKSASDASPLENLPDYLPEEDTPVKDANTAMASTASFKESAGSFLSAAANFLQNSFYW